MGRIRTLDGWRAIAILLVIWCHAAGSIWPAGNDFLNYAKLGALGVDVFFALSGILITRLLIQEYEQSGRISLKAFYIRRAFRVQLPSYFYLAVIGVCSMIWSREEFFSSVFFLRNYFDVGGPYTSHLWSLAVEEHFYLIWPAFLAVASVKYGQRVALVAATGIGLWRALASHLLPLLFSGAFAPYRTDYRIDSLFWGCAFAFVLHRRESIKATLPFIAAYVIVGQFDASSVHRLLFAVAFPLAITATATNPEWLASRVLDCSALRWIAKISYGLYLWQGVFLVQSVNSPHWWQRFPVNVLMAFAVAAIAYRFIDAPLQRIGHRIANASRGTPRPHEVPIREGSRQRLARPPRQLPST